MPSDLVTLGKIVGFHGLKGEVKVTLINSDADIYLDAKTAVVESNGQLELSIASIRAKGRQLFITFKEFDDRTAVEHLNNCSVSVPRNQLRRLTKNEWWLSDLIGISVYTTDGREVGTIISVIDGAVQTLEIKPVEIQAAKAGNDSPSILVPFVKELVPIVDIEKRRIEVVDLPGLLEAQ